MANNLSDWAGPVVMLGLGYYVLKSIGDVVPTSEEAGDWLTSFGIYTGALPASGNINSPYTQSLEDDLGQKWVYFVSDEQQRLFNALQPTIGTQAARQVWIDGYEGVWEGEMRDIGRSGGNWRSYLTAQVTNAIVINLSS